MNSGRGLIINYNDSRMGRISVLLVQLDDDPWKVTDNLELDFIAEQSAKLHYHPNGEVRVLTMPDDERMSSDGEGFWDRAISLDQIVHLP